MNEVVYQEYRNLVHRLHDTLKKARHKPVEVYEEDLQIMKLTLRHIEHQREQLKFIKDIKESNKQ